MVSRLVVIASNSKKSFYLKLICLLDIFFVKIIVVDLLINAWIRALFVYIKRLSLHETEIKMCDF